ncbi:hypothetical protein ACFV5G_34900 [Streptomyces sp. NPDC059766]|uniref:hypothetical protein n=1 Tax=Streptomyces sp. NPDC059766 TaxID=3346940 RepID=UPI00366A0501
MPYFPPPRTPSGPRRRSLLASTAGAALLVGCSPAREESEETASRGPSVTERARARAAQDSTGIVERYDLVIAAYPALAKRLEPLRAETLRHVTAFGGVKAKPSATPSAAGSPTGSSGTASPASAPDGPASAGSTPSTSASSGTAAAPGSQKEALTGLAAAERALADQRAKALLDVPGELARLLASVAAAGAAHAYLLTEGTK